jgi:hypothetical protein
MDDIEINVISEEVPVQTPKEPKKPWRQRRQVSLRSMHAPIYEEHCAQSHTVHLNFGTIFLGNASCQDKSFD